MPPFPECRLSLTSSSSSPYYVGNILQLTNLPPLISTDVRILKVMEPITLSVVLQVEIMSGQRHLDGLCGTAILKLFDRRFADGLREGKYGSLKGIVKPWNPDYDADFIAAIQEDPDDKTEFKDWTIPQLEALLYRECMTLYQAERKAYEHLAPLQGEYVPKLYANGWLEDSSRGIHLQIPGLLLEFIPGFSLRNVADYVPEDTLQALCDEAISVLNRIDDLGILNKDVRLDNVLIRQKRSDATQETTYKPVFIDFALSEVRDDFSAEEWTVMKCQRDEEGALGHVAQMHLRKITGTRKKKTTLFPFVYTPSYRYTIKPVNSDSDLSMYQGPLGTFVK